MASFRLPPVLRPMAGGARTVEAGGDSLRAALDDLTEQHPALRSRLLDDDGEIDAFVNVYVDGEDVRVSGGLDTPLAAGASVIVLPAMAGGSPTAERDAGRPATGPCILPHGRRHAARRADAALAPTPGRPPVREARVVQPDRLGQGPRRLLDARRRRRGGRAVARAGASSSRRAATPASRSRCRAACAASSVTIVMPAGSTPEREQLMRLFGADVDLLARRAGLERRRDAGARARRGRPHAVHAVPVRQPREPAARTSAARPRRSCACVPEVDVFVAGLGTGGTLMGCARRLRRDRPDVQIVAAEPLPGEGIDGLRSLEDGYTPEILDLSLLDRKLLVSNAESVRGLRALAREEGLFAGVSSGGVLHAAMRVARELEGPANIVMVLADGGWKYLSAGLWDTPEDELAERMEQGIWW